MTELLVNSFLESILNDIYSLPNAKDISISITSPETGGLINSTWIIGIDSHPTYVLQRVNNKVFTDPWLIDKNLAELNVYLQKFNISESIPSVIPVSIKSKKLGFEAYSQNEDVDDKVIYSKTMVKIPSKGYFRLLQYVNNSYTVSCLQNLFMAKEAGRVLGRFMQNFSNFDFHELNLSATIPNFHNLPLRYDQFCSSLESNKFPERILLCQDLIDEIDSMKDILASYEQLSKGIQVRVTHHDTKISNILFDRETNRGICLVDLDTIMPGYFISDIGDMFRTMLSGAEEDESDLSKVNIRLDVLEAIVEGFLPEIYLSVLTELERGNIVETIQLAGEHLFYMQALRFLTDFLLGDIYYPISRDNHNLDRTKNQIHLLKQFRRSRFDIHQIVSNIVKNVS